MPKSEGSITINTPIEKAFDAAADPEKRAQYINSAILTNTKGKPDELGSYSEWLYRVAGMKIYGKMTVSEVEKPRKLVLDMSGTMPGKLTWSLEQDGQAVIVYVCVEYRVPGGILGKIANQLFLGRMNQKNLEKQNLQGLKAYCER
jgi:uncharacterized protein YndB with AHSA1/START domain